MYSETVLSAPEREKWYVYKLCMVVYDVLSAYIML